MSLSLPLVSQDLVSHCTLTVQTGTNASAELPREQVQTVFSLRFGGAYPLKIKGLKQGADFVGFELSLTGPDECEQLIKALELAAAGLRRQAGLVAEAPGRAERPVMAVLPQEPAGQAQEPQDEPAARPLAYVAGTLAELAAYHEDWYAAECGITRLLVLYGQQRLPSGEAVASYVVSQIGAYEPATETTRSLWTLFDFLSDQGVPDLEMIQAHAQEPAQRALLAAFAAEPVLDAYAWVGFDRDEDRMQLLCDATLTRYFRSVTQSDRLAQLQQLSSLELDASQRRFLGARHHEAGKLESQMAKLLNLTIG